MRAGPKPWFFDAWSAVYDLEWVQRAVYRPEHDAVLAALRGERLRQVLDLGCGTGQLAHRLRAAYPRCHVVGSDWSGGMLAQARGRDHAGAWVRADALRLPFAASTFDAVVSTQAFHWFPDQAGALREVARVLRPGGCVALTLVRPPVNAVRRVVEEAARLAGQPLHWPSTEELAREARAAGLRIEREERIFRLPGALLLPPVLTLARRVPTRVRRIA